VDGGGCYSCRRPLATLQYVESSEGFQISINNLSLHPTYMYITTKGSYVDLVSQLHHLQLGNHRNAPVSQFSEGNVVLRISAPCPTTEMPFLAIQGGHCGRSRHPHLAQLPSGASLPAMVRVERSLIGVQPSMENAGATAFLEKWKDCCFGGHPPSPGCCG